ncbi:hypothetical protein E1171_00235, partial [Cytophagales bacterium RKSG123]|nr:hypothetical protein [Xanthovirga aplysinae]
MKKNLQHGQFMGGDIFLSNRKKCKVYLLGVLALLWLYPSILKAQNWGAEQKGPPPLPYLEMKENNFFGEAVALDGQYAVVGQHGNQSGKGAAYVLWYNGNNWIEQAKLTASDGVADDRFGRSVSISGDYIVVGAYFDDDKGEKSGSAYLFEK